MKISSGVEWAVHACALLAALPTGKGLRAEALAGYHDLPPAYMAKQLQALSKAGLITSNRGAHGGYRLAKKPTDINLWNITAAIEGETPAFRCTEIRQQGPCRNKPVDCQIPCPIASSFHTAEIAFRDSLKSVTLATIAQNIAKEATQAKIVKFGNWLTAEMTDTPNKD